ncbi:hypothetical protein [Mycolicibacterium sarraceniae]|uniref:Uncharacterized protein n=1 Tax=Mycolicibacterium sarraceniae TaxID=1534348 RepID=A0A7I7SQK6_9MYCO|nr:hypothetical protein [Mycolicibacterium sarraceniae]BBY59033.1 hypothetical protein MSAR_21690 [Mycolicibacterium sarraceniae]
MLGRLDFEALRALAALAARGHTYVLNRQAHISNAASAELVCDELDKP